MNAAESTASIGDESTTANTTTNNNSHISTRNSNISSNNNNSGTAATIVKEGKVLKWGGKLTSRWQTRRLVLRPLELSYFKVNKNSQVCRAIDIREDTVIKKRPDKHQLAYEVITPGFRSILVQCESREDYDSWMDALSQAKRNAPAHPIRVMIVGDDEEPTHGKARMVTKLVEALAGEEMAKSIIPMRYYVPTPSVQEKGLLASLFSSQPSTKSSKSGRDSVNAIFSKSSQDSSLSRNTVAANGRRTIDVLIPLEDGGKSAVKVVLWCAPSGDAFAKERAISFVAADVILFVFSVSESSSFDSIGERWVPEAHRCALASKPKDGTSNAPTTELQTPTLPPFFLMGTRKMGEMVSVSESNAKDLCSRQSIQSYGECRLEEPESVQNTFSTMIRSVVSARKSEGLPILDAPSPSIGVADGKKSTTSPKAGRRSSKGLMSMVGAFSKSFARRGSKPSNSVGSSFSLPPPLVSGQQGSDNGANNHPEYSLYQTKSSESIKTETNPDMYKPRGSSQGLNDDGQEYDGAAETTEDFAFAQPGSNKKKSTLVSFISSITTSSSNTANIPPPSRSPTAAKSRAGSNGNEDDDADSDGGGSLIGPDSDEELEDVNPLLNAIDFSPLNAWTDDTSYRHRRTTSMGHESLTFSLKKILETNQKKSEEKTPQSNGSSPPGDEPKKFTPHLISIRSQKGFLTAIDEKPTEEQNELTDLHAMQEQKHKEINAVRTMLEKMHQDSSFKMRLKTAHEELMMVRAKYE